MLWALIAVLFIVASLALRKQLNYWKYRGVPYLKPWEFLKSVGRGILRKTSILEETNFQYNQFNTRYYGTFQLLTPMLAVTDPELIKQLTIKDFDSFVDHRTIITEDNDPILGKFLIALKGQKWKEMRSTLSPAYTSSKIKSMFHLMSECAEQFTDYFTKDLGPSEVRSIEMKDVFTRYTNDVIATCAFGVKVDSIKEKDNEFYRMGREIMNNSISKHILVILVILFPRMMNYFAVKLFPKKMTDFFRHLVLNTMKVREEQNIYRPDLINIFVEAKKGSLKHEDAQSISDTGFATVEESAIGKSVTKKEWTDDDFVAQAVLMFIGGFETTSAMLSFLAYELAVNPDIQEKLRNEIDAGCKECDGKITYEILLKMKYLDMVISETLRKWPPNIATDRVCTKPFTIQPAKPNEEAVHLSVGDIIAIPICSIQRDPKHYTNPDKFDPERFNDENKSQIKPFTYIPFGAGPRNCIGSRFALLEIKMIVFRLLSKFELCVVEKTPVPFKLSPTSFSLSAKGGFWLGIKKRCD